MDYITRVRDTGFIACKTCHYALLPSHINFHFRKSPHSLDQKTRNRLFEEVKQWPNLIFDSNQIQSHIDQLPKNPKSFSELSLYKDGFACFEHSYIVRNRASIQIHYREAHEWTNPRPQGRKAKENDEVPWKTNIYCQQFFHTSPGHEYFLVSISSISTSKQRRNSEVQREESEIESESDSERPSEEIENNETSIQGIFKKKIVI